jgi:Asp-tRNA(Asn)/Glu-tRNA(Gln) amidotransferase A subunit family amidase
MGKFWRVTDSLVLLLVSTTAVLAAGAAEAGAAVAIVKIAGAAAEAATTLFNGIGLPAISIPNRINQRQNAGSCANNWTSVYGPDNYVNGLLL